MRNFALVFLAGVVLIPGVTLAQSLTEFGAVTAGSAVGGASGKGVSKGIDAIFGKVNQQTKKASATKAKAKPAPALKVGQSAPKPADTGGVPLPPEVKPQAIAAPRIASSEHVTAPQMPEPSLADATPALPPPPSMSLDELKTVTAGMNRADVLKFGEPSSRITMFEDGHLSEVYSYYQHGQKFGSVRLTDGAVSSVQAQ
jgi:hypothetical protein